MLPNRTWESGNNPSSMASDARQLNSAPYYHYTILTDVHAAKDRQVTWEQKIKSNDGNFVLRIVKKSRATVTGCRAHGIASWAGKDQVISTASRDVDKNESRISLIICAGGD